MPLNSHFRSIEKELSVVGRRSPSIIHLSTRRKLVSAQQTVAQNWKRQLTSVLEWTRNSLPATEFVLSAISNKIFSFLLIFMLLTKLVPMIGRGNFHNFHYCWGWALQSPNNVLTAHWDCWRRQQNRRLPCPPDNVVGKTANDFASLIPFIIISRFKTFKLCYLS